MTKRYCVIGKSLPHTLSPFIYGVFGLDYGVTELPCESALKSFVLGKEYDGYNVTIPYKEAVIPFLDGIDSQAKKIGAVNTVVRRNGKYFGYNTDIYGMEKALNAANIEISGRNVLILGTGGTAKTAGALAQQLSARKINYVSRNGAINYQNCYKLADTEIIINTTPVGMFPEITKCPVDIARFTNLTGVFDAIYNPFTTELVKNARGLGIPSDNGLYMLAAQAKKAFDIFSDCDNDEGLISVAVKNILNAQKNIVLTGMPSSGKSTVGKIIAQKTGRAFFDTDSIIEKETGKTIPQIFDERGQEYFRSLEKEAIAKVSGGLRAVIATGGGAVLDKANVNALQKNGVIVFLERDINQLSAEGRPLSVDAVTLIKMYKDREPLYRAAADFSVQNEKTAEITAKEIIERYEKNIGY